MKIKKKIKVPAVIFVFIALLVLTGILFSLFNIISKTGKDYIVSKKDKEVQVLPTEKPKTISCTRTTRLDNKPQYDRALSLIKQRIDDNNIRWKDVNGGQYSGIFRFTPFSPELTNCIYVNEADLGDSTGLEGYFIFDDKNIKTNYFPITVNKDYGTYADDVVTASLLTHEITHIQQYLDSVNGKVQLSCVDREIDAFVAQQKFYLLLSAEEIDSVQSRIERDNSLHPQLQMLKAMIAMVQQNDCLNKISITDKQYFTKVSECDNTSVRDGLREMITNDSYYKKQCEL